MCELLFIRVVVSCAGDGRLCGLYDVWSWSGKRLKLTDPLFDKHSLHESPILNSADEKLFVSVD